MIKKIVFLVLFIISSGCSKNKADYGVFLGINTLKNIDSYNMAIIDAQGFSKENIEKVRQEGVKIYSYLNIGAVEKYRPYYDDFAAYILKPYENWADEYWIDITNKDWQNFIVYDLAEELVKKGINGFFIDNIDIYYHYENDDVYESIKNILHALKSYKLPVIINGGDIFIKKLIKEGEYYLIEGINQEGVFSHIDNYEKDIFNRNDTDTINYYAEYLANCKKHGLDIYLLEYTKSKDLILEIKEFCNKNDYHFYISETVNLDK